MGNIHWRVNFSLSVADAGRTRVSEIATAALEKHRSRFSAERNGPIKFKFRQIALVLQRKTVSKTGAADRIGGCFPIRLGFRSESIYFKN